MNFPTRFCNRALSVPFVFYLLCTGMVVSACMMLSVPAYCHDWLWPFTKSQAAFDALDALQVWHDRGLGYPSFAPNAAVAAWALFDSAAFIGPIAALNLFCVTAIFGAGCGVRLVARSWGIADRGAWIGGLLYGITPVIYNKLIAGHVYYILTYSLLPYALYFLRKSVTLAGGWRWCLAGGFVAGLMGQQFQGITIMAIVFIVCIVTGGAQRARLLTNAIYIIVLSFTLHIPDYMVMVEGLFFPTSVPGALPAQWITSQSIALPDAIPLFSYIGGYASAACMTFPAPMVALYATLAIFVFSIASARLEHRLRPVVAFSLVLLCIGTGIVSGSVGPLSNVVNAAYRAFPILTSFRELYNFSMLIALAVAVAAAAVSSGDRFVLQTRIAVMVLVAAYMAPFILSAPKAVLNDPKIAASAEEILRDAHARSGRIAFFPGAPALSAVLGLHGVDSFDTEWNGLPAVTYSDDPLQLAYFYQLTNEKYRDILARRFGISIIWPRPYIADAYQSYLDPFAASQVQSRTPDPEQHVAAAIRHYSAAQLRLPLIAPRVRVGIPTWKQVRRLAPDVHLVSVPLGTRAPVPQSDITVNPREGWTQSERWISALPELACLPGPSVFQWSRGVAEGMGCDWKPLLTDGKVCLVLRDASLHALAGCMESAQYRKESTRIAASLKTSELVYLPQRYDGRWRLFCATKEVKAPLVLADAYAVGWLVPRVDVAACEQGFRASFAPDAWFRISVQVIWGLYTAFLLGAVLSVRFMERRATVLASRTA